MKKISLKKLLNISNANIIDIRENDEFLQYNIYGSINIPYIELYNNYNNYLSKDQIYYIVCEKGYRSKKLVKMLIMNKYNVVLVKHGLNDLNSINL